jgi:xylulokinase
MSGQKNDPLFLGFDIGSHSCKGVLIDAVGNVVAGASIAHPTERLRPGWEEQDPENWWNSFIKINRKLLGNENIKGRRVAGVGLTGFVPGLCFLDDKGEPVRRAIMHTDLRAEEELEYLDSLFGVPLSMGTLLPKLLWVKKNEPDVYKRGKIVLSPHGYLVYRLTGAYSCDYDTASIFGGVFDEGAMAWDEDACSRAGIDPGFLPPLLSAGVVAGRISSRAATESGLSKGVQVLTGSGDSFTAVIGSGAVRKGDLLLYMGTSGTRLFVEKSPEELIDGPHFGSGKIRFVGRIFSCGETLERVRTLLGKPSWEVLDGMAEGAMSETIANRPLFIPNEKQRRVGEGPWSSSDCLLGIGGDCGPGCLFLSAIEGVAFLARDGSGDIPDRAGRVILSGGPVKSFPVKKVMAACFGGSVLVSERGDSGRGAALLAAYRLGSMDSLGGGTASDAVGMKSVEAAASEVHAYEERIRQFGSILRIMHGEGR